MSGLRLGRLLGSLFTLAALVSGIVSVDLGSSSGGGAQAGDIVWQTVHTADKSVPTAQAADIVWQ